MRPETAPVLPSLGEREFGCIRELMQRVSGIQLGPQKKALVASRLASRLRRLGVASFADYVGHLQSPAGEEERRVVVDLLTTNETYFFRETVHFERLAAIATQSPTPLQVWSAACSSGEEAWSIAMTLHDARATAGWRVLGSDLCRDVLETAAAATYRTAGLRGLDAATMRRHFLQGVGDDAGRIRVRDRLREHVEFRLLNLIEPLPRLGPFDVVFLRNVLIYFERDRKRAIVDSVARTLRPGGWLLLGHSESLHGLGLPLQAVQPAVYRRMEAS